MKPFLILQARPETEAADDEYAALLAKAGLDAADTVRLRLDREAVPSNLDVEAYSGVIVGGGPGCVSDVEKPPVEQRIEEAVLSLMPAITEGDVPFMGCCYGLGILAHHLGGVVNKARFGEPVGPVECTLMQDGSKRSADRRISRNLHGFRRPQGGGAGFARCLRTSDRVRAMPDPDDPLSRQCLCDAISP